LIVAAKNSNPQTTQRMLVGFADDAGDAAAREEAASVMGRPDADHDRHAATQIEILEHVQSVASRTPPV